MESPERVRRSDSRESACRFSATVQDCDRVDQLQVGNGPETENGPKMAGRRPPLQKAPKIAEKRAGQMAKNAGQQNMAKSQLSGHLSRPYSATLGSSPVGAAGQCAKHFQFRAHFPPVAGQRGRKASRQHTN